VRPCAPSSDVWPHPRAGPAWHQVFRVFAAACHRAPDHALPSSQGPPTISSDLDTTTATRWLKPPYPRARRRKRSRTLATAYSDLPPSRGGLPSVSVGRGPKSKLFREAISSPALQHILMYHKRAYALVRDLRPTDSPEGHTYYTNPGRGRLLCTQTSENNSLLGRLANRVGEPVKALVETVAGGGARRLDVPVGARDE